MKKRLNKYKVYHIEKSTWKTKVDYSWEPETNILMFSEKIDTKDFLSEDQLIVKLFNTMYDNKMKGSLHANKYNLFNKIFSLSMK